MCKSVELGKIIINMCLENQYELNTSKLQKLLYFMQKLHLKKYNTPLFPENIIAWVCGPAIDEIHKYFFQYHLGFSKENRQPEKLAILDAEKPIICHVLSEYGTKSPMEMIQLSKLEPSWKQIWDDGNGNGKIIPIELLQES